MFSSLATSSRSSTSRGCSRTIFLPKAMSVASEFTYGDPVWGDGGRVLALPVWPAVGGTEPSFPIPHSLPGFVRLWVPGNPARSNAWART